MRRLTEEQVRKRLGSYILANGGQTAVAIKLGYTLSFVNQVLHGGKPPSGPILELLGLKREVSYVPVNGALKADRKQM